MRSRMFDLVGHIWYIIKADRRTSRHIQLLGSLGVPQSIKTRPVALSSFFTFLYFPLLSFSYNFFALLLLCLLLLLLLLLLWVCLLWFVVIIILILIIIISVGLFTLIYFLLTDHLFIFSIQFDFKFRFNYISLFVSFSSIYPLFFFVILIISAQHTPLLILLQLMPLLLLIVLSTYQGSTCTRLVDYWQCSFSSASSLHAGHLDRRAQLA